MLPSENTCLGTIVLGHLLLILIVLVIPIKQNNWFYWFQQSWEPFKPTIQTFNGPAELELLCFVGICTANGKTDRIMNALMLIVTELPKTHFT